MLLDPNRAQLWSDLWAGPAWHPQMLKSTDAGQTNTLHSPCVLCQMSNDGSQGISSNILNFNFNFNFLKLKSLGTKSQSTGRFVALYSSSASGPFSQNSRVSFQLNTKPFSSLAFSLYSHGLSWSPHPHFLASPPTKFHCLCILHFLFSWEPGRLLLHSCSSVCGRVPLNELMALALLL